MLYIGIDPGETWCGFAALETTPEGVIRVEARTYDVENHHGYIGMATDIIDLLPHAKRTHIVCEDFRIRRQGHQTFSAGNTLRLLGALEYGASQVKAFSFSVEAPTDKFEQINHQLYGRILRNYRNHWPKSRHTSWHHCLSAWRVLGQYLMMHDRGVLQILHKKKRSHPCQQWLPANQRVGRDRVAEAAVWCRPGKPASGT